MDTQERTVTPNRLREVREDRLKTLQQVAGDLGTTKGYLSELERGLRRPRGLTQVKFARYWGVDRDWLFPPDEESAA